MADALAQRKIGELTIPEAGTYEIDPAHSVVELVVRHLGLAKVRGRFNEFSGVIEIAEDPKQSSARATIQAASVDTRNEDRDGHLRSPDFLDVESHPTLEFRSTSVRQDGSDWVMDGELTVRGVTRPITLMVDYEGAAQDPWGNARVGFSATGQIDREEYGLTWNQALETGGWLVGRQIKLDMSVEAIKQ